MTTSSLLRAAPAAMLLALGGDWEVARPDYRWSFPRDHWAHPAYRTEWWYFTGHLVLLCHKRPWPGVPHHGHHGN